MKITYYPGCSLENTAVDYAASIAGITPLLDLELEEITDWNCCGATAAHSINHELALALPARNLMTAQKMGRDVVAPCALCFNRLKVAEKALKNPEGNPLGLSYQGAIKIWDLLDYLTQETYLQVLSQKVVKPLKGLKAVGYYGCVVARPPDITDKKDYENPQNMERLLTVLGATPLDWSYKTDCCGAGLALSRPDIIDTLTQRLYERALAAGAECFVVSCQMCQANLDLTQERISKKFGKHYDLPVLYFTELIGLALGHPQVKEWLAKHLVNPLPLLQKKGLI
ncbi:MAG: CoB--CoM heterodisulfide reductase iron-sulfur subunit B family protein [Deltaproteobacteria bacterium]|nr:CoB--CoM heterodisulfide reductase iron-sulfur subunit B family protein [Deltaproteobacteria bacterium]MBI4794612.1 CoB--CoM heterodisulfide reductase iron-sulfur subunit B family protein [Deltaproteobacteria bacterium]